ncbi:FkbM family methyltransferase [Paracoccaceae bacterium]|nr:FkbM family methyltransferase [Paracoccaceae bacterium]
MWGNSKMYELFLKALLALHGFGWASHSTDKEVSAALRLINNKKRKKIVAIDVGGNHGLYADALLQKSQVEELLIFEPQAELAKMLIEKYADYGCVSVHNVALSNKTGAMDLYRDKAGSGLASLLNRRLDHFDIHLNEKITVKVELLKKYTVRFNSVDLIKLDVEGHELSVLQGLGNEIHKVKCIQFEFGGANLDAKTSFQDFWYFFTKREFDLFRISPFGLISVRKYTEMLEIYRTTNYIAVKR